MQIIGKAENENLVCIISREEICKVFNHYSTYSSSAIKLMEELKIGNEVDLSKGYNFRTDIIDACQKTVEAFKAFGKAQSTLLSFSELITKVKDARVGTEEGVCEQPLTAQAMP